MDWNVMALSHSCNYKQLTDRSTNRQLQNSFIHWVSHSFVRSFSYYFKLCRSCNEYHNLAKANVFFCRCCCSTVWQQMKKFEKRKKKKKKPDLVTMKGAEIWANFFRHFLVVMWHKWGEVGKRNNMSIWSM